MSWEIKCEAGVEVIVLAGELTIQEAAEFHRLLLPVAEKAIPVRVQGEAVRSIHTAILQSLYALSRVVTDFGVLGASEAFQAAETRTGLTLKRASLETAEQLKRAA